MGQITYIAGRPLKIGHRIVQPGEEVDPSIFPRIESLVASGRLYRVYNGDDYSKLPSWLFKAVMTRQEAEAKIAGDPGVKTERHDVAATAASKSMNTKIAEAQAIIRREGPSAWEKAQAVRGDGIGPERDLTVGEDPEATPAEFDPGEHTVAEVEAYLAEHPEQTDAVLDKERAGKNRKGLVGE